LRELEARCELAQSANAGINIGFPKHVCATGDGVDHD
jgi:hypothetical protein